MHAKPLSPVSALIHRLRRTRLFLVGLAAVFFGLAAAPAWGASFLPDIFRWNSAADGSYTIADNWTDNFGFSGVPDASNESALFNLDGSYVVYFFSDVSAAAASLTSGDVTWSLNAGGDRHTYTLDSLSIDPGDAGGSPSLTIMDGTVNTPQLNVKNGGQLVVASTAELPGDGTFVVTGSGSTWTLWSNDGAGNLFVGQWGDGELTVSGGATAAFVNAVSNREVYVGANPASTGTITVTGAGSSWTTSRRLTVGAEGKGTLLIEDGGRIENGPGEIGFGSGSIGTITVTGSGSTWANRDFLVVGDAGTGTVRVEEGSSVSSHGGRIGDRGGDGNFVVVGSGSNWTVASQFSIDIGRDGKGSLAILNGGSVSSGSSLIGELKTDAVGKVDVLGAGSIWTVTGEVSIGGDATTGTNGGAGMVTVQSGAVMTVTQEITLFPDGLLTFAGDALTASEVHFEGGGTFTWNSGTLHVGIFDGDLTNEGGTLAPGQPALSLPAVSLSNPSDGAPGSTTVTGDYTQKPDATLAIEIGGTAAATQYDFVDVTGTAQLGGELHVTLIDGFVPDPTDQFLVLDSGSLINFFINVGSGQRLTTTDGIGSFLVSYGATSAFNPDQVVLSGFQFEENPPVIREQVAGQTATAGSELTLSIDAIGRDPVTYQWYRDGVAIPGATGSIYSLPSAQTFHAGDYTVTVTNPYGEVTSDVASLTVDPAAPSNARLLNLSTRGLSQSGDNVLIPGFVVGGSGNKRLLIRTVGPTLSQDPFDLVGTLPDPSMALKKLNTTTGLYEDLASNDDWETNSNAAEVTATAASLGAFAITDSKDAALLVDLAPGQYSVVAGDKNGASGIGIVELYDADGSSSDATFVNISNRGYCGLGNEVMIPGFVISDEGPKTLLIRVVGPTLEGFGVAGTMADPKLTIFSGSAPILENDDWGESSDAAKTLSVAQQVGAFPLVDGSKDAAFVVTLDPGAYTVVGSSVNGLDTGVVLVEIYVVP